MKPAFTTWQFLLLVVPLFLVAAIMYPVFMRAREISRKSGCPNNLKNLGLATQQYCQDYNGKFPLANSGGNSVGWAVAFQPYIKSAQVFQCPSETNGPAPEPRSRGYTDYWLNSRLARQSEDVTTTSTWTILLGDGNDGRDRTDARYALAAIPAAWKGDSTSPLYRHLEGANYGFVDGHVKWFKANDMASMNPNASPAAGLPTFALK